jgi:hypothetical protein
MPDFARLSRAELERLAAFGDDLAACERDFLRAGATPIAAALDGADRLQEWRHYPDSDVYDPITHAQYFYHAHAADERAGGERQAEEHGHFHTFLRARGIPLGIRPLVMPELAIADSPAAPAGPLMPSAPQPHDGGDSDPWTHLVALSMDGQGRPRALFTTNRWVTDETWHTAADVAVLLDRFIVGDAPPCNLLNRWLTAFLGLFRPQIIDLLVLRDDAVMGWRRRRRGKVHVFEDRRLEITSICAVDIDAQRHRIDTALRQVA